jgi:hypothetical protein
MGFAFKEKFFKIPVFAKNVSSLYKSVRDNSVTIALAYVPKSVASAASSPFLFARMQLSRTCDNCLSCNTCNDRFNRREVRSYSIFQFFEEHRANLYTE